MRKETEEVFDALMLKNPTLKGLVEAVSFAQFIVLVITCKVLFFTLLFHIGGLCLSHWSSSLCQCDLLAKRAETGLWNIAGKSSGWVKQYSTAMWRLKRDSGEGKVKLGCKTRCRHH